jgi:hypothetical protein
MENQSKRIILSQEKKRMMLPPILNLGNLNLIHGIFHLEDPQIIDISSRMGNNNTKPSEIEDDTTSTFNYRKAKLVHGLFH